MANDDDMDPFQKQFEEVIKRIEKLVNARLTNINEQITTLAGENDILNLNNVYLAREIKLLNIEISALEHHLAKKDKALKKMLDRNKELVAEELKRRQEEEFKKIPKQIPPQLPPF